MTIKIKILKKETYLKDGKRYAKFTARDTEKKRTFTFTLEAF